MARARSPIDAAFRGLLLQGPVELFRALDIPYPREPLPTEFGYTRKLRADFVGRAETGEVIHIENQARNERMMAERMLEYRLPIRRYAGRAPRQYVFYVGKARLTMTDQIDEPDLHYRYHLIDLRNLDSGKLIESGRRADNFYSLLCAGAEVQSLSQEILRRAKRHKESVEDAYSLLLLLCQLRGLSVVQAAEVINMPETLDLMQVAKLRKSAELVLEKGKALGREEGREEGVRKLILRMLEQRFGKVSPALARRVLSASQKEIDRISLRLVNGGSLNEIFHK